MLPAGKKLIEDVVGDAAAAPRLLVDDVDDALATAFGALPERLYVLQDGKVAFRGGQGPFDYSLDDVRAALRRIA